MSNISMAPPTLLLSTLVFDVKLIFKLRLPIVVPQLDVGTHVVVNPNLAIKLNIASKSWQVSLDKPRFC